MMPLMCHLNLWIDKAWNNRPWGVKDREFRFSEQLGRQRASNQCRSLCECKRIGDFVLFCVANHICNRTKAPRFEGLAHCLPALLAGPRWPDFLALDDGDVPLSLSSVHCIQLAKLCCSSCATIPVVELVGWHRCCRPSCSDQPEVAEAAGQLRLAVFLPGSCCLRVTPPNNFVPLFFSFLCPKDDGMSEPAMTFSPGYEDSQVVSERKRDIEDYDDCSLPFLLQSNVCRVFFLSCFLAKEGSTVTGVAQSIMCLDTSLSSSHPSIPSPPVFSRDVLKALSLNQILIQIVCICRFSVNGGTAYPTSPEGAQVAAKRTASLAAAIRTASIRK